MKFSILPGFTALSLVLCLTAGAVVFAATGCSRSTCGTKHQKKMRAKKVKRMAPGMSL